MSAPDGALLRYMIQFLLNCLFPLRCIGNCGQWNISLCTTCLSEGMQPGVATISDTILGPFQLHYLGVYQQPIIQQAIHSLKYGGIQSIASVIGQQFSHYVDISRYDYIVPVPLHLRKQRERGFNQSWQIALAMHGNTVQILVRNRYTTSQATLNRTERLTNLHNAFITSPRFTASLVNSRILLIDDVYTTGSTIQRCREVLQAAGASCIDEAVIAID